MNNYYEVKIVQCADEVKRLQSQLSECKINNKDLNFQLQTLQFLEHQQEFEFPSKLVDHEEKLQKEINQLKEKSNILENNLKEEKDMSAKLAQLCEQREFQYREMEELLRDEREKKDADIKTLQEEKDRLQKQLLNREKSKALSQGLDDKSMIIINQFGDVESGEEQDEQRVIHLKKIVQDTTKFEKTYSFNDSQLSNNDITQNPTIHTMETS